jgi:hypothetical protein
MSMLIDHNSSKIIVVMLLLHTSLQSCKCVNKEHQENCLANLQVRQQGTPRFLISQTKVIGRVKMQDFEIQYAKLLQSVCQLELRQLDLRCRSSYNCDIVTSYITRNETRMT